MQESCELKHGKLQNFKTQEWKIQVVWILEKYKTFSNANETRFQQFTLIKLDLHAKT